MSGDGRPPAPPPRPFLLRRAWIAWTVAGVVTVAGAVANGWMIRERAAAGEKLAAVREELATASARADDLVDRQTPLRTRIEDLRADLRRCVLRLDERIGKYNTLSDAYGELDFLPVGEEATGLRDRFVALRDEGQPLLRRCREAAGGPDQA